MKGWETKSLGEVCQLINRGISPKYVDQAGVRILNQKCVRNHRLDYELARRHDIAAKSVAKERFLQKGDVLVNSTGVGTLGRVAQVREEPLEPTTIDSHVTIVRPKLDLFEQDFFGYMLIVIEDLIKAAGEGCGGQTELARAVLANEFLVRYPNSLGEQRRIVAILDEAFAGLEAMRANAEKNLQNARDLFDSYLNSASLFEGNEFPTRPLATLCDRDRIITYGVIKLGEAVSGGVPCLRTSNVRWLDIETEGMKHIAIALSNEYRRTILRGGEVLVNVRGTLGGVAVVKPEMVGWNVSREIAVVPIDRNKIDSFYLAYWIGRKASQAWLTGVLKGAAYTGINIEDLRELPVAIPNLHAQRGIVKHLDGLLNDCRLLESIYRQKLAAIAELKQSILQKAFSGQLTSAETVAA